MGRHVGGRWRGAYRLWIIAAGANNFEIKIRNGDAASAGQFKEADNGDDPQRGSGKLTGDVLEGTFVSDPKYTWGTLNGVRQGTFRVTMIPGATLAKDALDWKESDRKPSVWGDKDWSGKWVRSAIQSNSRPDAERHESRQYDRQSHQNHRQSGCPRAQDIGAPLAATRLPPSRLAARVPPILPAVPLPLRRSIRALWQPPESHEAPCRRQSHQNHRQSRCPRARHWRPLAATRLPPSHLAARVPPILPAVPLPRARSIGALWRPRDSHQATNQSRQHHRQPRQYHRQPRQYHRQPRQYHRQPRQYHRQPRQYHRQSRQYRQSHEYYQRSRWIGSGQLFRRWRADERRRLVPRWKWRSAISHRNQTW